MEAHRIRVPFLGRVHPAYLAILHDQNADKYAERTPQYAPRTCQPNIFLSRAKYDNHSKKKVHKVYLIFEMLHLHKDFASKVRDDGRFEGEGAHGVWHEVNFISVETCC